MRTVHGTRIRIFLSLTTLIIALSFVYSPNVSVTAQQAGTTPAVALEEDLTGIWSCDDGGTYYVRQVENTVWWLGQSSDKGATFTNLFQGLKRGDKIQGSWVDVPQGKYLGSGLMTLSISRTGGIIEIRRVGDADGFGGSLWKRTALAATPEVPPTPQPPPIPPPGVCTISGRVIGDKYQYRTTLRLVRPDGSATPFSRMALGGEYKFTNVPEGTYQVRGKGRYPVSMGPLGSTGLGIFSDSSTMVTCRPNGSYVLDFVIRSIEG